MKWVGCRKAFQEESKMAFKEKSTFRDFPGGPAVKTLRSHRRGRRFDEILHTTW